MKPGEVCKHCTWVEDENGLWNATCGFMFEFNEGSPARNRFKFCPKCGLPLKQENYVLPDHEPRLR